MCMKKNVVILGGGIAGLNSGIELLQKGHKVTFCLLYTSDAADERYKKDIRLH